MDESYFGVESKIESAGIRSRDLSSTIYYYWWLRQQMLGYIEEFYRIYQSPCNEELVEPTLIIEVDNGAV